MSRRPTHAELDEHYRHEWLQERHDAQTEPCPDCRVPAGTACRNPITGRALHRAPAHPGRIRARAQTAGTGASSRRSTTGGRSLRNSPQPQPAG